MSSFGPWRSGLAYNGYIQVNWRAVALWTLHRKMSGVCGRWPESTNVVSTLWYKNTDANLKVSLTGV